eukprot:6208375-Pleurochrysis_carterae.AAC.1
MSFCWFLAFRFAWYSAIWSRACRPGIAHLIVQLGTLLYAFREGEKPAHQIVVVRSLEKHAALEE